MEQGSQLTSQLAGAEPDHVVIDFCAGAGGKTIALAGSMRNFGQLYPCDVEKKRLRRCSARLSNAVVRNCVVPVDLSHPKGARRLDSLVGKADVVFLDVPCSGSGRFRREVDRLLRFKEDDLGQHLMKQALVLRHARQLVKPGGLLVYVTCSFVVEENETQVRGAGGMDGLLLLAGAVWLGVGVLCAQEQYCFLSGAVRSRAKDGTAKLSRATVLPIERGG